MAPRSAAPKSGQSSKHAYRFTTAEDIRRALSNPNETTLTDTLTALRNQLTLKPSEDHISPADDRLLLVNAWLGSDPGLHDIFKLWEQTNTRQLSLLSLILSILSSVFALLSSHYTYHATAKPLLRTVLSQQWSSKLNSYLSTTHNELILLTLKLYNAVSAFGGGKERRAVLDAFPWELKTLPKLLHMRRRSKGNDDVNVLDKPDIRTYYVLFLLSFLDPSTPTIVKTAFLEQRRDTFQALFKGLSQDPYSVIRRVLEISWTGIWCDAKLKRTLKISMFNENTIQHFLKIYDRNQPEDDDPQNVPADVVHHFLLAISTRPGVGVCFKDQGWYSPEDVEEQLAASDEDNNRKHGGRVYNKILAGVLKGLKVNEDARQQELALRILEACPELVAGYWHAAALTLEPRLSSRWIANIAFFGSVISLPVPSKSFLLQESTLYRPTPPPLSTLLENILPSVNIKVHLSRGLQSQSSLVQHCAALALAKCLTKFGAVIRELRAAAESLEEDEEEGCWTRRLRELEREVGRRVPECQVVVALAQQKALDSSAAGPSSNAGEVARSALLAESAQRLLWLYHQHLPWAVAETRFDVAKVLQRVQDDAQERSALGDRAGFLTLTQLHILRLLQQSEDFSWTSKSGSSRGNFSILLRLYVRNPSVAVRSAVGGLLRQTLSTTTVFQHDADEVDLWLQALPRTKRAEGAKAPDGTSLMDEGAAVIAFLDDCLQRCIKTPYRYFEELQTLQSRTSDEMEVDAPASGQQPKSSPSPLLMAVLEQFQAKVSGNHLAPSDVLAISTFVRKLVLRLATKLPSFRLLEAIAQQINPSSWSDQSHLALRDAIQREHDLMTSALAQFACPTKTHEVPVNPSVEAFLTQAQQMNFDSSEQAEIAAYELVDWLRLVDQPMATLQFHVVLQLVERLHAPVVAELLEYVRPESSLVWGCRDVVAQSKLDFPLLFLHADNAILADPTVREMLTQAIKAHSATDAKRALSLIDHRLGALALDDPKSSHLLDLVTATMSRFKDAGATFLEDVTLHLFNLPSIRLRCQSALSSTVLLAFENLLRVSLESQTVVRGILVTDYVKLWSTTLASDLDTLSSDQFATALAWLPYVDLDNTLALFDHLSISAELLQSRVIILQEAVITNLVKTGAELDPLALSPRIPQLLQLQVVLAESPSLEQAIVIALDSVLPAYHDGQWDETDSDRTLADAVTRSLRRWGPPRSQTLNLDVHPFLTRQHWSSSTASIISRIVYAQRSARPIVADWLTSAQGPALYAGHTAVVLDALIDSSRPLDPFTSMDDDVVAPVCDNLLQLLAEPSSAFSQHNSSQATSCLVRLSKLRPVLGIRIASSILKIIRKSKDEEASVRLLALAAQIDSNSETAADLSETALKWMTQTFSSEAALSSESRRRLELLSQTLKVSSLKAQHAESAILVALQQHLADRQVLDYVDKLLSSIPFKPATVNRFLQTVIQNTKFHDLARSSANNQELRSTVVAVLHRLFHLHPSNTCQPSHIEPLRAIYGGTLSQADRRLASIFRLFEVTRKGSVGPLLCRWSPLPDTECTSALEAIQALDSARVFKTCLDFPQWYDGTWEEGSRHDERLYDPSFVLLLFAQMLVEGGPSSALGWVQLFRSNAVSLLIRGLSSHREHLRSLCLAQLAGLYSRLEVADMQEKPHVLYILDLLRNAYPKEDGRLQPPRLSAYTTLHLAHALRGVFYPSTFTYPITSRFLLQRPELDTSDVPTLYNMLYSVDDQWKRERAWIVRFLADGMVGRMEWKVLKRRHTWDLVASIFQSEAHDQGLRRNALEFLANLTCNQHATMSLVLSSSILSWIEIQLQDIKNSEALAWARILENIIATLDSTRATAATGGEWLSIISRCLLRILTDSYSSRDITAQLARIILRLSQVSPPPAELDDLLAVGVDRLSRSEAEVKARPIASGTLSLPEAPHTSRSLWQTSDADPSLFWGYSLEALWRAAMSVDRRSSSWDALTSRILVWRAVAGESTHVGEFARRQVVCNLATS